MNRIISSKKYLPDNIKNKIGKRLGSGIEGVVYQLGEDKVIKIASYHPEDKGDGYTWASISSVLKSIQKSQSKDFVKIYSYGLLSKQHKTYYVIARKLQKLNYSESCFIDDVADDDEICLKYVPEHRVKKHKRLVTFLTSLSQTPKLAVYDIHSGNIMKNKRGQFKFVDLGYVEKK